MFTDKIVSYIAMAVAAALAIALTVLGILYWIQGDQLDSRTKERNAANASLELQNTAVENWKTNAEAAQELAADALKKARDAAKARQPAVSALDARLKAGTDTCASAVGEVRKGLTP